MDKISSMSTVSGGFEENSPGTLSIFTKKSDESMLESSKSDWELKTLLSNNKIMLKLNWQKWKL